MPHRVIGLWIVLVGIIGVILVGLFVVFGRDARKAAASGPRWKRKLLATGLTLLTVVGVVGCENKAPVASSGASVVQGAALESLLKDPRWLEYRKAWSRAEDIVFGRAASMPIYTDDKSAAVIGLTKAGADLDALAERDLITSVEHRYLKCELSILIGAIRGSYLYSATARDAVTPESALARTRERVAHLKELAKSKVVPESAWDLLRKTVVEDIAAVEIDASLQAVSDEPGPDVWKLSKEVRKCVWEIDQRLGTTDLHFEKAWDAFFQSHMSIIGDGSQGAVGFLHNPALDLYPESPGAFSRLFHQTKSNLQALESNEHLPKPVYALLGIELDVMARILSEILTIKPEDPSSKGGSYPVWAREQAEVGEILARVKLRMRALGDLAASGGVRPRVIDNALAIAETDYQSITDRRISPEESDVERHFEEHPQEKITIASLRTTLLELRKKISQRDSGVEDLGRQYHWVRLLDIWRQSERIWEMGIAYPFNSSGQRHARTLMVEAARHIQSLRNNGLLEVSESEALDRTFADLSSAIGSFRNSDHFSGTCYLGYGFSGPGDETPEEFRKQLELIEKIQANGKLHPHVLSTLLYGMERNLHRLRGEAGGMYDSGGLDESNAKPASLVKDATLRIDSLKAALNSPRGTLAGDKRWLQISLALRFAAKIADPHYIVEYQERKVSWIGLSRARLNLRELLASGTLTRTEFRLVAYQVGRLWEIIAGTPVFAIETRYRSHDMPWSVKLDDSGRMSRDWGRPYCGYDGGLDQWLGILGKAPESDQVSPVVFKEVMRHIKLICMGPGRKYMMMQDLHEMYPGGVLGGKPEAKPEVAEEQLPDGMFDPAAGG